MQSSNSSKNEHYGHMFQAGTGWQRRSPEGPYGKVRPRHECSLYKKNTGGRWRKRMNAVREIRGGHGSERVREREIEVYLHNRPDSQKSMISWPDKDDHL